VGRQDPRQSCRPADSTVEDLARPVAHPLSIRDVLHKVVERRVALCFTHTETTSLVSTNAPPFNQILELFGKPSSYRILINLKPSFIYDGWQHELQYR
jgi:hypothetical protein